jgi:hypothetical protein
MHMVLSRGGVNEINKEYTSPCYAGRIRFDFNEVANIIGLRNLLRYFDVTYDSCDDNCFHIWKVDFSITTQTCRQHYLYQYKEFMYLELVGVDDALPTVLWTLDFLKAQGFVVTDNVAVLYYLRSAV